MGAGEGKDSGSSYRTLLNTVNAQIDANTKPPKPKPVTPPKNVPVPEEWTNNQENTQAQAPGMLKMVREIEAEKQAELTQPAPKSLGFSESEMVKNYKALKDVEDRAINFKRRSK